MNRNQGTFRVYVKRAGKVSITLYINIPHFYVGRETLLSACDGESIGLQFPQISQVPRDIYGGGTSRENW